MDAISADISAWQFTELPTIRPTLKFTYYQERKNIQRTEIIINNVTGRGQWVWWEYATSKISKAAQLPNSILDLHYPGLSYVPPNAWSGQTPLRPFGQQTKTFQA